MPATRNIQRVHVVFVRDINVKYWTSRSDVPDSASAIPTYSEHSPPPEMLGLGLAASFAVRRPTPPSDLQFSVQRFETCVRLVMNGVDMKSADVWLVSRIATRFDCQRFWHRLTQIKDHVANWIIQWTVQRQLTRSLITKSIWHLVGLVPDHCSRRALLLHLITRTHTHTLGRILLYEWSARHKGR